MEKRANLTIGLAVGHSSCQWLSSSPALRIHFSQCGAGSVLWGMCSLKLSAERIQSVLHVASMSLPKMPKQNDESTGCKPKHETQQHSLQASRKKGQQLPKLALDPKLFHFKLSPAWNGSLVISRIAVIVVVVVALIVLTIMVIMKNSRAGSNSNSNSSSSCSSISSPLNFGVCILCILPISVIW